ncbi:hypothetical protein FUAX_27920 [Fulvitalea axinellae]|uniref:Thioesterase domain-containing protein n=1 Tax=Fulvitalea axinellae TaxID=1182444 RepID=A0AAU9DH20_9BACT|nr:hypothetical protein FUAX_27920 [Fulvitalea axinellae]
MSIFNKNATLEIMNATSKDTLVQHLKIEYTEMGEDFLKGKMPVNPTTHQPHGVLHGGASVVLAESLGSVAANMVVDYRKQYCVGMEINANHIRPVVEGYVYGTARPLHLGSKSQVWDIKIENEEGKLVCVSRLTVAVLDKKQQG